MNGISPEVFQWFQNMANQFQNMGYSPMTGFGGPVSSDAQKGAAVDWNYKLENAPSRLQAVSQQAGNNAHNQALAEQFANSAYKDQDTGPIPVQGLLGMINSMANGQPYRTEPLQGFQNIFSALRGQ